WASLSGASGSGSGTIGVTVSSNAASTALRSGAISVSGQAVNISQNGTACTYALQSSSGSVPASGGAGAVGVVAAAACGWDASSGVKSASFGVTTSMDGCSPSPVSYANWIGVTETTVVGASITVQYAVAAYPSAATRVGTIQVGDRTFTITQIGAACGFSLHA